MTGSKVDSDLVRELSQLLEDNNLTELEWSKDGETIRVVRNKNVVDISQFNQSTQSPISQDVSKDNQDPLSDLDHPGAVNSQWLERFMWHLNRELNHSLRWAQRFLRDKHY